VKHEEALADLARAVEVDAVPRVDVLVVYQVLGRVLDVADEGLQPLLPSLACLLEPVDVLCRLLHRRLGHVLRRLDQLVCGMRLLYKGSRRATYQSLGLLVP